MFDTEKFGAFVAYLRKESDMTQSELGDVLNVTRQAVSKYERGESFPDVSVLKRLSEVFGVSIDILVNSGQPSKGESKILRNAAYGRIVAPDSIDDVVSLAPLLRPSLLSALSDSMTKSGLDISNLLSLSEYLSDNDGKKLLQKVSFDSIEEMDKPLLERLLPIAGPYAVYLVFSKIIDGEFGLEYLDLVYPYYDGPSEAIEAAVVCGALDVEALYIMQRHQFNIGYYRDNGIIPQIFTCPSCGKTMRYFHPQRCMCGVKPEVSGCLYRFREGGAFEPMPDSTAVGQLMRIAGEASTLLVTGCPDDSFLLELCDRWNILVIIADSDMARLRRAERIVKHKRIGNIIFALMDTDRLCIADGSVNAVINLAGTPEREVERMLCRGAVSIRNGKVVFEKG